MTAVRPGLIRLMSAALACAAAVSCSAGHDSWTWFRTFSCRDGQEVSFDIELSDSCVYSIDLISRLGKNVRTDSVTLCISFVSPSGLRAGETVTYPSDYPMLRQYLKAHPEDRRISTAATADYRDISWRYRDNVRPAESGTWTVSISIPDRGRAVMGAGLTINTMNYGKR